MNNHTKKKNQTLDNTEVPGKSTLASWRPRFILGITAFITFLAIVYAFFIATPIYEAQAMVQLGKINGGPVEPYDTVRTKLIFSHQMETPGLKRKLPLISNATIIGERKDVLLIKAIGRSNKEAVALLQSEIDKLIQRQSDDVKKAKKAYRTTMEQARKQLKVAESSIKRDQKSIAKINQKVHRLSKEDTALLGTYFLELQKLRSSIERNESWRSTLLWRIERSRLMLIDTLPPTIVDKIITSEKPIKPRKALIVAVGFVSGLLFSLLLVLFLDFWTDTRKNYRNRRL